MSDIKLTKWSMPHDSEAWPDTGQVMNAQEAAVAFNALIDRLTQVDKLARELAEMVLDNWKYRDLAYEGLSDSEPISIQKSHQLLKLYEEEK